MANIRLIVLNYKRPNNVHTIINTYKKLLPITVVNNNPNDPFPYLGNGVDVINNEKNWLCMERWVRCFDYDEPYKLIIDDDLLPHPSLVKKMYDKNLFTLCYKHHKQLHTLYGQTYSNHLAPKIKNWLDIQRMKNGR